MKSKIVLNVYRPEKECAASFAWTKKQNGSSGSSSGKQGCLPNTSFRKLLSRDLTWLKSRRKRAMIVKPETWIF